jgi:hypothetical protein
MDFHAICADLIRADHEDEVLGILARHDLDADGQWLPLGGIENNLSIAGNQQSSAAAALVEKLVNSIDSLMLLECRRRGIDPESAAAPPTMTAASTLFFGIPDGNIARLRPPQRAALAEHVQLVATGSKTEPSYTIIDVGEGQRPADFAHTFCSLVRSNKLRTPFVQGKFNMGGSGALPFCGRRNLQLVVSRRHPDLVKGEAGCENVGWGWTVIRRRDAGAGRRSSFYEYLAPGGRIPCFAADALPVRPSRDAAYAEPLTHGSLVKLYNYQIEFPSAVVFDLNYELSRRLYQLGLPVRLYERRDYRGHSKETILTGMSVRVEDDRAGAIEEGFPDSGVANVEGVGEVPVQVVVFRKGVGKNFLSPQAAVLFTVNGQVHGGIGRRFCSRDALRLDFIKNDLMVVLNCTDIPARVREDLFMPSRDRLRECGSKKAFEDALEAYLADHEELTRLNLRRREEELRGRLADDRPLTEALKNVIDNSPELRELFKLGTAVATPTQPGDKDTPFEGQKFPTYFRPERPVADGEEWVIACPQGSEARARFVTDAVNDYFTRASEPGMLTVDPAVVFGRMLLHDGRATLVLRCPPHTAVGAVVDVAVEVTDLSRTVPFRHTFKLRVVEAKEKKETEPKDPTPKSGALSLPKIVEVDEDGWAAEEFGPSSGLAMQSDVDGGLIAKVNVANEALKRTLARTPEPDWDLTRKRFVYGLVLSAVSLWQEFSEREDRDELIRSATTALARVLLPTITVLGTLEPDLLASR